MTKLTFATLAQTAAVGDHCLHHRFGLRPIAKSGDIGGRARRVSETAARGPWRRAVPRRRVPRVHADAPGFLGRSAWPVVDLVLRAWIAKPMTGSGLSLANDWNEGS